jgi:hypothetical protein
MATGEIEYCPRTKRKLVAMTAKELVCLCDGKPGEILWALKDAMGGGGEAFYTPAQTFAQVPRTVHVEVKRSKPETMVVHVGRK